MLYVNIVMAEVCLTVMRFDDKIPLTCRPWSAPSHCKAWIKPVMLMLIDLRTG